jgi:hypothetical protein
LGRAQAETDLYLLDDPGDRRDGPIRIQRYARPKWVPITEWFSFPDTIMHNTNLTTFAIGGVAASVDRGRGRMHAEPPACYERER